MEKWDSLAKNGILFDVETNSGWMVNYDGLQRLHGIVIDSRNHAIETTLVPSFKQSWQ